MKNPNVYIIAGPNGAGKTTFAKEFLPEYAKCDRFVNADSLASGLSLSPGQAALRAGRLLLDEINRLAEEKQDFAFETTLSGKAYFSFLKKLKSGNYSIHLFFLWIPDIKLSLARIADRVKRGGHDIPEDVVRRRFHRGLRNFFQLYKPLIDSWILFDGSLQVPIRIAEGRNGTINIVDQSLYEQVTKILEMT